MSEFIEQKIRDMKTDIDYIQRYRNDRAEAFDNEFPQSEERTKALEEEANDDDEERRKK